MSSSELRKRDNALYLARLLIVPNKECDALRQAESGCSVCRIGRLIDTEGRDLICTQQKKYPPLK